MPDYDRAANIDQITKALTDKGRIIEAGWQSYRVLVLPPTASAVQVAETRKGFFAGAQHLFGALSTIAGDDDGDPTEEELGRMEKIHAELEAFTDELRREVARRTN